MLQNHLIRWLRRKNFLVLAAVALLIVMGVAVFAITNGSGAPPTPSATLSRGPIEQVVTADGLIESAQKTEVYAPSNLRVQEVLVQEGDPVESGEVLAELDTEALSLAIRRAELSIQNAEANLSNEQTALLNTITNSRNSLDSAAVSLQTAQREYDTLLAQKGREPAVISAAINLDTAKRAWENNQALYGTGGISAEALTQTKDALDKAQSAYDDAMRAASDALNRASETLAAAKIRQKNANDVLSDAVAQNTDPAAASVELQKVALEEKQIQLRDARICAPAAGRVTLVQAKVGAPASGLLFIIEDDQQLIVRARVEEADVASLAVGMPCRIQPIGQEGTLEGVVTLVPPAAERDESGVFKAAVGDDAYFAVEVSITSTEPGVLIGMNAEVSLIVAARSDCFSAPKALVYHDEQHSWVLTRSKSGKIMEVPVQTGIESSQMTEIISDALYEGMELFSR